MVPFAVNSYGTFIGQTLSYHLNGQLFNLPSKIYNRIGLFLLGLFFIAAGTNHFVNPDFYIAIMPPYLPAHLELVYLSGLFEILGGVAVFLSPARQLAGNCLIVLLIAVFPANLYMAMNSDKFVNIASAWALYARLPLQLLLIWWTFWVTRNDRARE